MWNHFTSEKLPLQKACEHEKAKKNLINNSDE